jgi:tetratricopeptide (TPR) repeat protein
MRSLACLPLLLGLTTLARADSPAEQAKAHLAVAQRMFAVQQYDKAIAELQQAYVLDPKPEYLYAIAQAFRLAGDCTKAIRAYEQYLKTNPVASEAEKARANIERCKTAPPPPNAPPTPPPVVVVQPPPPVLQPPVSKPNTASWTRDYVGHVLLGGGVVLGVVGTTMFVSGGSTIDSINSSPTYDVYASRRADLDGAKLRQRLGVGAMITGGLLVIGGVMHYRISSGGARTLTASVGHDHAMLVCGGTL